MKNALQYSHELLSHLINKYPQGTFIDATLGNGNDIHYILNHPQFDGFVYGFDIQDIAIESTLHKLQAFQSRYQLIKDSHENIATLLKETPEFHGAIFNLGYLPKGDHSITTCAASTMSAIQAIEQKLVIGGQIILVIYSGHSQGQNEKDHLLKTLSKWPQNNFQIVSYSFINQINEPPMLLVIEKIKD